MDEILTWQTAFFTIGIFVVSLLVRRLLEAILPTLRKDTPLTKAQLVWENFFLPSIPVFTGVALALIIRSFPYPKLLESIGSKILFGAVCGFFSSWSYRIVRSLVGKKYSIELPDTHDMAPDTKKEKP
jgi:hypothetical protein